MNRMGSPVWPRFGSNAMAAPWGRPLWSHRQGRPSVQAKHEPQQRVQRSSARAGEHGRPLSLRRRRCGSAADRAVAHARAPLALSECTRPSTTVAVLAESWSSSKHALGRVVMARRIAVARVATLWVLALGGCQCQTKVGTGGDGGSPTDGGSTGTDSGTAGDAGATSLHIITGFCPGCPVFPGARPPTAGNPTPETSTPASPTAPAPASIRRSSTPNDGALYPPNTNVIEVHFLPGHRKPILRALDFENGITDVRVETQLQRPSPTRSANPSGGCGVRRSMPTTWSLHREQQRGPRDPLTVTVRGTHVQPAAACCGL